MPDAGEDYSVEPGMIMQIFKYIGLIILPVLISTSLSAEVERTYYGAGGSSFPPYEFIDEYGRPSGFNIDIINSIAYETGLDIRITLMTHDEAVKKFSSEQIDFLTCVFQERGGREKLYTSPWTSIQFIAAFPAKKNLQDSSFTWNRIAVSRTYKIDSFLARKYPESSIIYTDTDLAALKLASSGETDCAILTLYSAHYLMDRYVIDDLQISERPVFSIEYSMMFSPRNPELQNRFDRGMFAIKNNGEFSRIYHKWFSTSSIMHDNKKIYGMFAILVALAIVSALIILFYILLRREVARRTGELNKEISHNYYIADLSKKLLGGASIENISRIILEYLAELTGSGNGYAGYIANEAAGNITVFTYSRTNGEVSFRKQEDTLEFTSDIRKKIFHDRDTFFSNEGTVIFTTNDSVPVIPVIKNTLCSPAVIGETVVGFIILGNSNKDYDSEDLNIIENFSSQYALAIQRMWFEHDLIRSEKKYRDIFNNVEDLLYIYDLHGSFLEVNNAFEKLFGYTEDELKHTDIISILSDPGAGYYSRQEVLDMLNHVIREGTIHGEVKVKSKSGKKIFLEYKNSLIFDETGNPTGIQGSARDITERKVFEKILIEAREKARESDSLKTNFLANMSHEMRTPLNAVIGFTDILIEEVEEPSHENYLRMIQKSGKLLLSIINEILDLSKIESGSLKIIDAPFNIRSLLKNVYNSTFVLVRAGKKNINLDFDCDHNISEMINADEHRIEQVMNNLLSNAVKFTDSGEINFGVNLNSSGMLEFYVEDSGIGISEENLPLVFERFRQVDYSSKRSYSGTGLGLSISKMIVEMMGGSISVESELNKGSKFIFTVPFKPSAADTGTKHERGTSASSSKSVLVVEDNNINRLLVAKVLEKNGFTCIMAVDGFEAVEEYKIGRHIDIILMDIQMPRMDGLEALGIIREIEKNSGAARIPIVALSAHVMKEDVQKFLESGFDSYIAKPFNRDDLIRNIIELTEK